jgi:hypothetical protein
MIQKFAPTSSTRTHTTYEVYKNRHSSPAEFHLIADMYERVMREDKILCTAAQRNLARGVFVNGNLHPKYEKAPLFFQKGVREAVRRHWEEEKKEGGREIWPARQKVRGNVGVSDEDEEICAGIACGDGAGKEGLDW